jgi:hypothetical protein
VYRFPDGVDVYGSSPVILTEPIDNLSGCGNAHVRANQPPLKILQQTFVKDFAASEQIPDVRSQNLSGFFQTTFESIKEPHGSAVVSSERFRKMIVSGNGGPGVIAELLRAAEGFQTS